MPEPGASAYARLAGRRLFISYPRGGRTHSLATQVQAWLQAQGAQAFRDETHVREGDTDAIATIERELLSSDAIVYLLGTDTPASTWQKREALLADREGTPLLVVQTATVALPFEVSERQPVDARGLADSWLPLMGQALQRLLAEPKKRGAQGGPVGPAWVDLDARRQAERAYLLHWLCGDFADRVQRYAAVSGVSERSLSPEARRRGLYHDNDLLLELLPEMADCEALDRAAQRDRQPVPDVLAAYQAVLAERGLGRARLAVLGDPGAGKTFSLQRLFCALATQALDDPTTPIPLFIALGDWTRAADDFDTLLDSRLRPFGLDVHWRHMRDEGRVVLLLDGLNEIPVAQRIRKADEVFQQLQDTRWAGALLSCRERDFDRRPLTLPVDRLTLKPLSEVQIMDFLLRWEGVEHAPQEARARAEQRFWALAAGPAQAEAAQRLFATWQAAGADLALFWSADEVPRESPNVYSKTDGEEDLRWRRLRDDTRSLLRLASSPFWLELLAGLPQVPTGQARLIDAFLRMAYELGRKHCEARNALDEVPPQPSWEAGLTSLAMALQGRSVADDADAPEDRVGLESDTASAATRLPRAECPPALTEPLLEFAIATQVLRETDGQVHFAHQLLQETLAARVWLSQFEQGLIDPKTAWPIRPSDHGWPRTGWEVVAELAAQSIEREPERLHRLIERMAGAHPEQAARCWQAGGSPALPLAVQQVIRQQWLPAMTDVTAWPNATTRAAIGRALGLLGLDDRPGVGVDPHTGTPDIAWARFADPEPWVYQSKRTKALPPFELARYLVTHAQFQAFVDAPDGYQQPRWWAGLARRQTEVSQPSWSAPNSPRDSVDWFEAVAFCRWLGHRLGDPSISLPTEQQWERAAAGRDGNAYPFARQDYVTGAANISERPSLDRTSAVGLYPHGASLEGQVQDLTGNLWEWCLNEYDKPKNMDVAGNSSRVLRGGSWLSEAQIARASNRYNYLLPVNRRDVIGFRVCRASPIDPLGHGATEP